MSPYLPPRGPPGCPTSILDERRKRNRTFIDPVTEVPRLENWFGHNTHPSHAVSYRMNPLRIRCKVSNTTSKFVFSLLRSDRKFVHSTAIHPRDYLVSIGKKKINYVIKIFQLILKYTEELNRMPYRQKFPRLEPKNVQFWFKNRRAKCKRLKMALFDGESPQPHPYHAD